MKPFSKTALVSLPLMDYEVHSTAYTKILPPIGLGYLATVLGRAGYDVEVIDAEQEKLSTAGLLGRIVGTSPSLVGISIPSPLVQRAKIIIDRLKAVLPHCTVIVGGNHPSIVREKILLEIPNVDVAFVGESEDSLVRFVRGDEPSDIKGLIYWDEHGDVRSTGAPDLVDIDSVPILDRKYFKNDPWRSDGRVESYICASRGCPWRCTYCSGGTIQGKRIRGRTVENLLSEIRYLIDSFGTNYLHFVDDNFLLSRSQAYAFCNGLNSLERMVGWRFLARANVLTRFSHSDFVMLASSGCDLLSMGVESGSPQVLERVRKKIRLDEVRSVIQKTHNANIKVKGFFIMGFPFETERDIETTREFILEAGFDDVNISFLRVFPGTELYEQLLQSGFAESQLNDYMQFAEIFGDDTSKNERLRKAELYLLAHYVNLNPALSVERILEEIMATYDSFFAERRRM